MDGYQFIAAIVQSIASLAWPAAIVTAVWIFRGKIIDLLPHLRFKYKDLDVFFRLADAEKEAKELKPPTEAPEPTPEETDKFTRLVRSSPRAAMLDRRAELEEAVQSFAKSVGLLASPATGLLQLTRELRKRELIDESTSALLDDLRAIGNTAAHDTTAQISEKLATRFGALADLLIRQFQIAAAAAEMNRRPAPLTSGRKTE